MKKINLYEKAFLDEKTLGFTIYIFFDEKTSKENDLQHLSALDSIL